MKLTGAELIVRLLERQGIRHVAGIPGGANLPLYDAMARRALEGVPTLRHILARHEQGAGFIAQGMARATGETAVCLATSGPGATNVLTALADAKLDSVPMVCFTGQVPLSLIGTDAFQEVDTFGMSLPLTKHNFLVRSAEELFETVPWAFHIAASGRPGPVLIDVPKDVQNQTIEFDEWPDPGTASEPPAPAADLVARAAEMINAAERPVLYIGGGVINSGASELVRQMAETAGIPVTMTLMGLGALPAGHPRSLGMLGMHAARFTNQILEETDLLIAVGVRFDDRATGKVAHFCPKASVIHIDIDEAELGKIRAPHIGMTADARAALAMLAPQIQPQPRAEWLARVAELKSRFPLAMPAAEDPCSPYGLIGAAAELLGPDAIVTTDVGQHQMWTAQAYPFARPRQFLTSGGLGTMGFGLPAAIGAAIACPDRTVACFSGDGSLLMNIQELATAAEEKANVKVLLMNNNSLGLVHQQQDLFYGKRLYACDYTERVDFTRIAQGFGVTAYDLGRTSDPRAMLADALAQPGPVLVNVPLASSEKVFPMVPPGAANRDMLDAERAK